MTLHLLYGVLVLLELATFNGVRSQAASKNQDN